MGEDGRTIVWVSGWREYRVPRASLRRERERLGYEGREHLVGARANQGL